MREHRCESGRENLQNPVSVLLSSLPANLKVPGRPPQTPVSVGFPLTSPNPLERSHSPNSQRVGRPLWVLQPGISRSSILKWPPAITWIKHWRAPPSRNSCAQASKPPTAGSRAWAAKWLRSPAPPWSGFTRCSTKFRCTDLWSRWSSTTTTRVWPLLVPGHAYGRKAHCQGLAGTSHQDRGQGRGLQEEVKPI